MSPNILFCWTKRRGEKIPTHVFWLHADLLYWHPYISSLSPILPVGFQSRGIRRRYRDISGCLSLYWTTVSALLLPGKTWNYRKACQFASFSKDYFLAILCILKVFGGILEKKYIFSGPSIFSNIKLMRSIDPNCRPPHKKTNGCYFTNHLAVTMQWDQGLTHKQPYTPNINKGGKHCATFV